MYKYNKCQDITFNKNFFAKEMKNFFEKFFSPKVSSGIYISGEFEVGRKLEVTSKYDGEISSNYSFKWEIIDENNEWTEIASDEIFVIPNELLEKNLRLTAIYEKDNIQKIFRSKGKTIKAALVNPFDVINSDFKLKERGNDILRDLLEFNGDTYQNKLTYFVNTNLGDQIIDTGFDLNADKISLGEELFIESVFNEIDDLIDIDFERVYSSEQALIDIYSSDLSGNTLGITYIDYGIKNGQKYFQSDVVFSVSEGNLMEEFEGLSSNTAYTIVHEIAHALGMRHPDDDPNGKWHTSEDTVMSYNFDNSSASKPNLSPIDELALIKMWGDETNQQSESFVDPAKSYAGINNLENSTFRFSTSNLDVDGDGLQTQLGDGLIIVRKLFSGAFLGDKLIDKAVSKVSTRNSNEIHKFLEKNIKEGLYDVDKDGDTTALGDGLLIFRSLNRDSFLEEDLIKGAISHESPYFNHEKPWESILNNIALLETYDNII